MRCDEVREALASYPDAGDTNLAAHLKTCAECRTELAMYEGLQNELHALAEAPVAPPPFLIRRLTVTVGEEARRLEASRAALRKLADPRLVAGGAIVAAGIVGAMLIRGRRRRKRTVRTRLREAFA